MKLIKKIAAIMLSVMMVLGMASVVSADEGETAASATTGTITITDAIVGQTYKIYKILDLESYDADAGNYVYKIDSNWEKFINGTAEGEGTGNEYLKIIDTIYNYVKWKGEKNDARVAEFAKKALEYAKSKKINPDRISDANDTTSTTVTFKNLALGYYVVESSVGTLCGLTTTNPTVTIKEKNGVPSVEKKVQEDSTSAWGDSNTADIGQTVNFQTTITAQPGAQNYVLHDKMDAGLTFDTSSVQVKLKKSSETAENIVAATNNYEVKSNGLESTNSCTFHVDFTPAFCNTLAKDDKIIVTYSATLNDDVEFKKEYKNETWLKYGENNETNHDTTTTKTFELPVFKYTKDGQADKALAGATFTLSKNQDGTNSIELVSVRNDDTNGDTYRVAKETEATEIKKIKEVTTTKSGKFTIKGLDADTYYLTETKQPKGYNKLSAPITVVIDKDGAIKVNDSQDATTEVKVLNNTGTILPTTGGNGTSLIYFLGAVLALVSGVVLLTKQRMKNS